MSALAYTANPLVVLAVTPPLLINLFDTGSGRSLMDTAQPIQNVVGGVAALGGAWGNLPFIFPEPWLLRAGGQTQIQITNLSSSIAVVRLDISLVGFKVFKFGQSSPGEV